jgi:hypothetical protein
MKLTKPQRYQLRQLAREPQATFGSARTRVFRTLERLGLASIRTDTSGTWASLERCHITDAGRAELGLPPAAEPGPECRCAGPKFDPDVACPLHPKSGAFDVALGEYAWTETRGRAR